MKDRDSGYAKHGTMSGPFERPIIITPDHEAMLKARRLELEIFMKGSNPASAIRAATTEHFLVMQALGRPVINAEISRSFGATWFGQKKFDK